MLTMTERVTIWHGSDQDFELLCRAIGRNCECDLENPTQPPCAAHRMLIDQVTMDHLAWVKFAQQRFEAGEWRRGRAA